MSSNGYKLVLFDFDGTLAQTLDNIIWCMEKTMSFYGQKTPSRKAVIRTVGHTLEESLRMLCPSIIPDKDMPELVSRYREFDKESQGGQTRLFDGVPELLKKAHNHGIRLAIVSNKGIHAIQTVLQRSNVFSFIDIIFSGNTSKFKKPDPDLYHHEIKPHFPDMSHSEVLVVGDTPHDISFAKASGLDSCWVGYGYGNQEACLELEPNYIARNVSDLTSHIFSSHKPLRRSKT